MSFKAELKAAIARLEYVAREEEMPAGLMVGAKLSEDVAAVLAALSTPPTDDVREALDNRDSEALIAVRDQILKNKGRVDAACLATLEIVADRLAEVRPRGTVRGRVRLRKRNDPSDSRKPASYFPSPAPRLRIWKRLNEQEEALKIAIGYDPVKLSIRDHPEIRYEYRTAEDRDGLVERILSAGFRSSKVYDHSKRIAAARISRLNSKILATRERRIAIVSGGLWDDYERVSKRIAEARENPGNTQES